MPGTQPLTEQEILVLGAMQAQDSLIQHLFNRKGKMYFVTDHLFSVCAKEHDPEGRMSCQAMFINRNIQGKPIPDGLDAFIERARKEPDFTGIVPLTEGARKALEARGLRPTLRGAELAPEGVSYNAYR